MTPMSITVHYTPGPPGLDTPVFEEHLKAIFAWMNVNKIFFYFQLITTIFSEFFYSMYQGPLHQIKQARTVTLILL